ncbi:MAG TPA: hypothetical protein VG097_00765 [Gemmata sp.]|jgi:hypothetical protein|nr:hypothetical protein [Gemmata sp.]
MEPTNQPVAVTEKQIEVPEGIRRARAAFLRDFTALIVDRRTRGKYVCYHENERVAVNSGYRAIIQEVVTRNIPEDAYLIIKVTPGAEREQQMFAEEADFDPA